jgi:hypothetical protein
MNPFEKYLGPEDHTHRAILNYIGMQYKKAVVAHPANEGKRTKFEQFKIKWLGMKSGLQDILIFNPIKGFTGLAIEVKVKGNKPTPNQLQWQAWLRECGWKAEVVYGFDEAKKIIDEYFNFY